MTQIETIYKIWCDNCRRVMYINNGDTNDLTVEDTCAIECPYCNFRFHLCNEFCGNTSDYELAKKEIK